MQSGAISVSLSRILGVASPPRGFKQSLWRARRLYGSYSPFTPSTVRCMLRIPTPHPRQRCLTTYAANGAAGDACKYAHVRTRVCRSIINIIAVARDEERPWPSPFGRARHAHRYHRRTKRKYRALAINGFTPEHLHVGRPRPRPRLRERVEASRSENENDDGRSRERAGAASGNKRKR